VESSLERGFRLRVRFTTTIFLRQYSIGTDIKAISLGGSKMVEKKILIPNYRVRKKISFGPKTLIKQKKNGKN